MSYSLKNILEWTEEGSPNRMRNLILFSTVSVYLFITIIVFVYEVWSSKEFSSNTYYTFTALMMGVYGFYTTTSPKSENTELASSSTSASTYKEILDKLLEKIK